MQQSVPQNKRPKSKNGRSTEHDHSLSGLPRRNSKSLLAAPS
jgi:hypothetical protein